jgi:hypothetical protein
MSLSAFGSRLTGQVTPDSRSLLDRSYQTGDERGPIGERVEEHVLAERVGAVADRAEPV